MTSSICCLLPSSHQEYNLWFGSGNGLFLIAHSSTLPRRAQDSLYRSDSHHSSFSFSQRTKLLATLQRACFGFRQKRCLIPFQWTGFLHNKAKLFEFLLFFLCIRASYFYIVSQDVRFFWQPFFATFRLRTWKQQTTVGRLEMKDGTAELQSYMHKTVKKGI